MTTTILPTQSFTVSTWEDQRNYFSGQFSDVLPRESHQFAQPIPGLYRLIDDKLYQILPGVPPALTEEH